MNPILAAACLAALALLAQSPKDEPWSDEKFSPAEIAASRELSRIQKRIARGDLPSIEFDFGSAGIRPESYQALDLVADVLLKNPQVKIRISAHACAVGSAAYNQGLSERRAKAVKAYLVQQGVPPPSIRFKGWGSSRPIADNSTEEGRRKNRRVELRVIHGEWGSVY